MAKLGSYYALCPLIDTNSLIGISEDALKGMIIVTLGKNISNRYKISDQKQLTCWRTKEKFTSPVIYDQNFKKYVGVFNSSYIKMWDLDENLERVKKYKFNSQIYSLVSNGKMTFIIFKNGAIHDLSDIIKDRKKYISQAIITSEIKNVIYENFDEKLYIGLVTNEDHCFYWTADTLQYAKFSKIELLRVGSTLKGYCFHKDKNKVVLLTLWSDGNLLLHPLDQEDCRSPGELFSVINVISTDFDVFLKSLDENYVAIYGADCNQEGAALIIYNTQFKVTQSKQLFKLFTSSAKLWYIHNAVFLPVGQNLAVVPVKLEVEQLAALIGSHKCTHKETDVDIKIVNNLDVVSWVESRKIRDREVPDILKDKISDYVYQGMPESMILEEVLPDILQKCDLQILLQCLRYFSDVPEKSLVQILKFLLEADCSNFKGNQCDMIGLPEHLQPLERVNLLNNILKKSFNESILLPYLQSQLSLNSVLLLLDYISLIGLEGGYVLPGLTFVETEYKLIEWHNSLLDSSYQKFILCNDDSVKSRLLKIDDLIQNQLVCLNNLREVMPLVQQMSKQKLFNYKYRSNNSKYSIEQTILYSSS